MLTKQIEKLNEYRNEAPELLDALAAAIFLGVSERTLKESADRLGIPYRRINSQWLFSKSRILQWLEGKEKGD